MACAQSGVGVIYVFLQGCYTTNYLIILDTIQMVCSDILASDPFNSDAAMHMAMHIPYMYNFVNGQILAFICTEVMIVELGIFPIKTYLCMCSKPR